MLYAVLPPSQYKVLLKPYMSPLCRFLSFSVFYVSLHCNVASLMPSFVSFQPLDAKTQKELETVLKGFLEPKQVLKLDTKVRLFIKSTMTCIDTLF